MAPEPALVTLRVCRSFDKSDACLGFRLERAGSFTSATQLQLRLSNLQVQRLETPAADVVYVKAALLNSALMVGQRSP